MSTPMALAQIRQKKASSGGELAKLLKQQMSSGESTEVRIYSNLIWLNNYLIVKAFLNFIFKFQFYIIRLGLSA